MLGLLKVCLQGSCDIGLIASSRLNIDIGPATAGPIATALPLVGKIQLKLGQ